MQRLFVALDLGKAVQEQLTHTIDLLRRKAPEARWVRPDGSHLTLVFLGGWPDEQQAPLEAVLKEVAHRHRPHRLRARGGGHFGSSKKPRVLWVGLEGDLDPLSALQADLAQSLLPLGHQPEAREYRPHLTLARSRDPHGDAHLVKCAQALEQADLGDILVSEFILYRSELSPKGARYTALRVFPLKG